MPQGAYPFGAASGHQVPGARFRMVNNPIPMMGTKSRVPGLGFGKTGFASDVGPTMPYRHRFMDHGMDKTASIIQGNPLGIMLHRSSG